MKLKKGDRIRLIARMISGWKGTGTVIADQLTEATPVRFTKDDGGEGSAFREEVVRLRRVPKEAS